MNTEEEIAHDQWFSEITENISQEAISDFTFERLRSYYIANPELAKNALATYKEAKSTLNQSPSAALVLFTAAIEVGLKSTLLKPVIYGLVHNESAADIISELTVKNNGFDRIKDLLAKILGEYGGIDLHEFKIDGHSITIWNEITILQNSRNGIVHRCELTTLKQAELGHSVATIILGNFLPSVLNGLGLELKKGFLIGNA